MLEIENSRALGKGLLQVALMLCCVGITAWLFLNPAMAYHYDVMIEPGGATAESSGAVPYEHLSSHEKELLSAAMEEEENYVGDVAFDTRGDVRTQPFVVDFGGSTLIVDINGPMYTVTVGHILLIVVSSFVATVSLWLGYEPAYNNIGRGVNY